MLHMRVSPVPVGGEQHHELDAAPQQHTGHCGLGCFHPFTAYSKSNFLHPRQSLSPETPEVRSSLLSWNSWLDVVRTSLTFWARDEKGTRSILSM